MVALKFNHCFSFAENNSEFEETYAGVWEPKEVISPIEEQKNKLVEELTKPNGFIMHAYLSAIEKVSGIKRGRGEFFESCFRIFLGNHIFRYLRFPKNQKVIQDFVFQLFDKNFLNKKQCLESVYNKVKNEKDTTLHNYFEKMFKAL